MERHLCLNFRVIIANILGVQKFRTFMVTPFVSAHGLFLCLLCGDVQHLYVSMQVKYCSYVDVWKNK